MQATTTQTRHSSTSDYAIGSPEYHAASLAWTLRRHADRVDEFADRVEAWGEVGTTIRAWGEDCPSRSAHAALALIETAQDLVRDAERIHSSELLGRSTKCSFLNDAAIALGATNGHSARGRGDLGYALMHAFASMDKYGEDTALANMRTKASSLRVHASSCRVIAGLCDSLARGEIRWIR